MRALDRLAWRSLVTHRVRTMLTALAIALGVAMIVATGTVNSGVRAGWASGENVMAWVGDMIDVVFTGIGAIILAAAGFLIYNALTMTVAQQRQQIGLLRSLGASRRQVMRLILLEAAATGALGVLIGLAAGPFFGRAILFWMERLGLEVGQGQASCPNVALSIVLGLGVTLLSALIPARKATRISPLTALREHEPLGPSTAAKRRRVPSIAGAILLLALLVYLILAPPGEWSGANPPWEWIAWLGLWCVWILGGILVLPVMVDALVRLARVITSHSNHPMGRLLVDNLERSPRRATLTVLSFAIGVATTVGIGGLLAFSNGVLVTQTADRVLRQVGWYIYPFDRTSALAQLSELDMASLALDQAVIDDAVTTVSGRADVGEMFMIQVPELSSVAPGFPTLVESAQALMRPGGFQFNEGDWETALPIMEDGCGLLLPPGVAARHKLKIGKTLTVQGLRGPVECTLAGIGVGETVPFSIISLQAKSDFIAPDQTPSTVIVYPRPGTDTEALEQDLFALAERRGDDAWIARPEDELSAVLDTSDQLQAMFNGLTLLAQVAAALGTINTTVISVVERRRELGLLRAVGLTRRQIRTLIAGESALLGIFGALLGLLAGVGLGGIFGLAYGGISFGLVDLALWPAVGGTVLPGIQSGWIGIFAAPLLAGGAALPAVRAVVRGSPIETLEGKRTSSAPSPRRQVRRPAGRRGLRFLVLRSLQQHPLRTALTASAVALGVAMVLAGDVIGGAIASHGQQMENQQSTAGILGGQLEQWLGVVGLVLLGMAAFVVFNAFLMSVTQRRRQIGVLRSLGLTRRQVTRLLLGEALWVGTAGTILGLVSGPLVGWGLVSLLSELAEIDPGGTMPSVDSVLLSVAVGLGTTVLAALLPTRRAMRIPPLEAVRESTPPSKTTSKATLWLLVGLALVLVLGTYLAVAPPAIRIPAAKRDGFSWHLALTVAISLLWLVALGLMLPALIVSLGSLVRVPLSRLWGAVGRLVADNLGRARGRVTLTVITLALSVALIVGITGSLTMFSQSLLYYYSSQEVPPRWALFSIGWSGDLVSWQTVSEIDLSQMGISDELYGEVQEAFGDRAQLLAVHAAILPELDVIPGSMSFLFHPPSAQRMDVFEFYEGDWDHAVPIMEQGCGILIAPALARRHGVWLYDRLTVPGKDGPVECTVAGLGQSANFGATIVGAGAADQFTVPDKPMGLFVQPEPDTNADAFVERLQTFTDTHDGLYLFDLAEVDDFQETMVRGMLAILNGPLLLAIAAAALGVVNTTAMSVSERQQELGLLRAVGATRRQVRAVVLGEAALIGLLGGLIGLLAGAGISATLVLAGDHSAWGASDLSLGPLLAKVVLAAAINGIVGTLAAPFVCALAGWLPVRAMLRGTEIETMDTRHVASKHPPDKRGSTARSLNLLVLRNLEQDWLRSAFSTLAVALGAAMIVAAQMISQGVRSGIQAAEAQKDATKWLTDVLEVNLNGVGIVILFAAGFLIFNAFAMAVSRQRRQIGVLRSLGLTRRQVMRLLLVEALVIGGCGSLLGLIAGPLIGSATLSLMRAVGVQIGNGSISVISLGGALTLGIGTTLVSVLLPARRATRISPLAALRQEVHTGIDHTPLWLAGLGLAIAVGLTVYLVIAPPGRWTLPPWDLLMPLILSTLWLAALVLTLPALIDASGGVVRQLADLVPRWQTTVRLVADNLRRERRRVTLTILTLVVGLTTIVSITGIFSFTSKVLIGRLAERALQQSGWIVLPIDIAGDTVLSVLDKFNLDTLAMDPQVVDSFVDLAEGRADISAGYAVIAPEIGAVMPAYPSFIYDLDILTRPGFYTFVKGDWDSALPIMQQGCGLLIPPAVAVRNRVGMGDTISLQAAEGTIDCVVAGIGAGGYHPASFISPAAKQAFDVQDPAAMLIFPQPGTDKDALADDLYALAERHGIRAGIIEPQEALDLFFAEGTDLLLSLLDALLLLAVVAAALGVTNTTAISVYERRGELGLLRAVGATRRQARAIIAGEAAFMGLLGGGLGLVSGAGIVVIFAVSFGGNSWGINDLPLWSSAWESVQPALLNGLFGLLTAPLICAGAAWFPARTILRGTAIETMSQRRSLEAPGKQRTRQRAARGALGLLARSSFDRYQTHTALSVAAVALGVAVTVAADVVSSAILESIRESQEAIKFMGGLLDQLDTWLTLVGVGITLAVSFLLFNAFGMSVARRRKQIGALRSLGMTRRQVMWLMVVEALLLGGLGTLVGMISGPLMGRATIALIQATVGQEIFAFAIEDRLPGNLLLAALLGLASALLAVLIPARQATRISPLVAMRQETGSTDSEAGHRRGWLALAVALVLGTYVALLPPARWAGTEQFPAPWDIVLVLGFVVVWMACVAGLIPAAIGLLGRGVRATLSRTGGAVGRLVADNLRRGRRRVTLTVLTFVIALSLIVGMTGLIQFTYQDLLLTRMLAAGDMGAWIVTAIDFVSGMGSYVGEEQLALSPQVIEAIDETMGDRIEGLAWQFAVVPELSFFGSTYFSFVLEPYAVQRSGDVFFEFHEGSWETALPLMTEGCGVLVSPMVATRNGASLGETITVTGKDGPVDCIVAGIGSPYVGASIVGQAASASFDPTGAIAYQVWPAPGEDRDAVEADLADLLDGLPNVQYRELSDMTDMQAQMVDWLPALFNALLLLAVVAAALGVVNTTAISVTERRQELGMLRAVGATRRQVSRTVVGEAALMGLLGGGLGLIAGGGMVVLLVLVYGGNSWGVPDLDLWPAAWRALQPALLNGLFGLVAAPLICAVAAWLPARTILRGTAIETMEAERQARARPQRTFFARGSIRTRFVLGTALLLALVLGGLVGAVGRHERTYLENHAERLLRTVIEGQTGLIELILPPDAQTVELSALQMGEMDASALLSLQAMMDDMGSQGLESFVVADRDGVTQLSLDPRKIGTLVDFEIPAETVLHSDREDGTWRIRAAAPIHNREGTTIGSLHMVADLSALQTFVGETRRALWLVGGSIAVLGLVVSWLLATPVVRSTRRLAAGAQQITEGTFLSLDRQQRWWRALINRTSLRLRLTVALVLVLILLVVGLEAVTVPVERHHLERTIQQSLTGTVEWLGEILSDGLAEQEDSFALPELSDLEGVLEGAMDLDLGKLQALGDRAQTEDIAYVALTDEQGVVQFSDQIALIGTEVDMLPNTEIAEADWHDEKIWVISTPLREGRNGERVGSMRFGVRRASIERYLDESRTLFRLTGVIAVLLGILLAQAIGGAVAAPVRHLAAGVERIGKGDLDVQFRVRTRDELATLAHAFDEMAAGLREREWLRDMFGRFVSREVAEAIRSGQVRLEGENRVVSVLFCDIRDFTLRSERHSPEEMVALLNEYLPVVVEAAQRHSGTVNKFGGDSTLIVYGAPHKLQESAYQAVLTALEVRSGLAQLNELLVQRGESPIRIGVGINTGTVLAGAVGPEARQEYTVIGDTVNLASRIEALNKTYPEYDVLISGQTYEALGSRRPEFDLVDLGELTIRGKEAPVRVWAVMEPK